MRNYLFYGLLCLLFLSTGCKRRFIQYPYAENNTTTTRYFGVEVSDDYQWLEMNPAKNHQTAQWLAAQSQLSNDYFSQRGFTVFDRISELTSFPRFSFIRSSSDTLYYAGIYPYSHQADIYRFDNGNNELIKSLNLPAYSVRSFNALVLHGGNHVAIVANENSTNANIYIYNLRDASHDPVFVIRNVLNTPLIAKDENSFFFLRDAFASDHTALGINDVFLCEYRSQNAQLDIRETPYYTDLKGSSANIFDIVSDESTDQLFVGKYAPDAFDRFDIYAISKPQSEPQHYFSIRAEADEQLRLAGADDRNLYIISINKTLKGTLYALNREAMKLDTIIHDPMMDLSYFSLIKDHAIMTFQNQTSNKVCLINKHTLDVQEIPVKGKAHYRFYHNKRSDKLYFQKESHIAPKEIFQINPGDYTRKTKISDARKLPFNPDDYTVENVTVTSPRGDEIHIQLTYKKGLRRDGTNPVIMLSYINAENAYLDKFNISRILYMDYGFIFVQRANADSRIELDLEKRADDFYAAYRYLIDERYSSPDRIGVIGREFGASSLMMALNKYPLQIPSVLIDGVYDFVSYNNKGQLLYHNRKLFQAADSASFRAVYESSPYHNIVRNKDYPPMLLMTTDNHKRIPADHTYRLTAKMQMRTKGDHPILMLTPNRADQLDEYDEYNYKMIIEHAFLFIANQLGVNL